MDCPLLFLETLESFKYSTATYTMMEDRVILHSTICLYSIMSTGHSDSDSSVSPPVTCVDTDTVYLHSQCSGACSDVQETAEVQS